MEHVQQAFIEYPACAKYCISCDMTIGINTSSPPQPAGNSKTKKEKHTLLIII